MRIIWPNSLCIFTDNACGQKVSGVLAFVDLCFREVKAQRSNWRCLYKDWLCSWQFKIPGEATLYSGSICFLHLPSTEGVMDGRWKCEQENLPFQIKGGLDSVNTKIQRMLVRESVQSGQIWFSVIETDSNRTSEKLNSPFSKHYVLSIIYTVLHLRDKFNIIFWDTAVACVPQARLVLV
jgi:hypothetical protein